MKKKISSTETSVFYGNLVYDIAGSTASDKHCVVLNNIRVDVVDYIKPATCNDTNFRTMWYEFEWENKVPVNTKHTYISSPPSSLSFLFLFYLFLYSLLILLF